MKLMTKEQARRKFDEARNHWTSLFGSVYGDWTNLYASIRVPALGTAKWRSNLFIPLVFSFIQEQLPKECDTLFGNGSFYSMLPRKQGDKEAKQAEAYRKMISYYLEKTGAYTQFFGAVLEAEKFPLGWVQMGWNYTKEQREYYNIQEGEVVTLPEEVVTDEPIVTWRAFNTVFPDPKAVSRKSMEYVACEWYVSRDDLNAYLKTKWAHKDTINSMLKNADAEKFLIHGVYSRNEIIWLSPEGNIIRQHLTGSKKGSVPFYFVTKIAQPDSVYGVGLVQILGDLNKWANLIENLKNDNLMLTVNKIYQKKRSAEDDPEDLILDPGKIVEHGTEEEFIKELPMGQVDPKAFVELERVMAVMNKLVGSAAGITTPEDLGSVNNQTATGAVILAEENARRSAMFAKYNKENFLEPLLRDLLELIQTYAPKATVERVLGEEEAKSFLAERANEDIDSNYDIIITGEDAAYSRSLEMQKIQLGMSLLSNLGDKVAGNLDTMLIAKRVVQLTGMDKNVLKEPTPEEQAPMEPEAAPEPTPDVMLTPEQVAQAATILEKSPEEVVSEIKAQGAQSIIAQVKEKINTQKAPEAV